MVRPLREAEVLQRYAAIFRIYLRFKDFAGFDALKLTTETL